MDSYIQYLEQVLGLKQVIWPEAPAELEQQVVEVPPARAAVQVLFVADKPWSLKAQDLFSKMREAMKIPESEVKVLFAAETSLPDLQISALSAERVVCFSPSLFQQISVDSQVKFLTHNPEELLTKPQLKKETWEDLKKVMKSLGLI